MITHATMQWKLYLKLQANVCGMKTVWNDWKRIYKSSTSLQLKVINSEFCLLKILKYLKKLVLIKKVSGSICQENITSEANT